MAAIPGWLLRHEVTIEPYEGTDGMGRPVHGAGVLVKCFRDDKRRLVRTATGDQVVSETTLYTGRAVVAPVESRVTLTDRTAIVIQSLDRNGGGLPTPDHLELILI